MRRKKHLTLFHTPYPMDGRRNRLKVVFNCSFQTNKTGDYAIAIVTKAMASAGASTEDFNRQWKSLLANTVGSITGPVMTAPVRDDGGRSIQEPENMKMEQSKVWLLELPLPATTKTTAVILMTYLCSVRRESCTGLSFFL